MNREDVLGIFPEASKEQVDSFMKLFGQEINPLKAASNQAETNIEQLKASLAQATASADSYKSQLEEANAKLQAGMSAEELLAQREADAAARERDFILKSNALDAKSIFVASGYFEDADIDDMVNRVTSEDAESTKMFAQSIVDTVKKQREITEAATKDALLKGNPSLKGSVGNGVVSTKDEFDKLPYDEQAKILQENPGLLSSFQKPIQKL